MEEIKQGYKQTDIGVIPEDWEVKPIIQIFDICNNQRLPISEDVRKKMQGIYPYYGPTRIQDYINEYRLEGEYALIGEDGDHFLKWKDMAMTQLTSGKFNVNNHAHIIKGRNNVTTTKWFYYFFKNRDITGFLARQGAGRYKLSKATLSEIPCAYPTRIQEQTAITTALSDTDALIAALDKKIAKKQQIKQGAMQQLLTGKRRLPGFSGEWVEKKLGDVCELKNGYAFKSDTYTLAGKFNILTIANVQNGFLEMKNCNKIIDIPFDIQEHQKLEIGDLLISMTGNVGRICFVDSKNCLLNQRVGKLLPLNINEKFLYHILRHPNFVNAMILKSHGGAQANLSKSEIESYDLIIPIDKTEQTAIAQILTDMDNEITQLEKERDKYKEMKAGMMQVLLTGKVRLV